MIAKLLRLVLASLIFWSAMDAAISVQIKVQNDRARMEISRSVCRSNELLAGFERDGRELCVKEIR